MLVRGGGPGEGEFVFVKSTLSQPFCGMPISILQRLFLANRKSGWSKGLPLAKQNLHRFLAISQTKESAQLEKRVGYWGRIFQSNSIRASLM